MRSRRLPLLAGLMVMLMFAVIALLGPRWPWLAPLFYAPPLLWPCLLLGLSVLCWLAGLRGAAWMMAVAAVFIAGPVLGWRSHGGTHAPVAKDEPGLLRVMTWNQGQHYSHDVGAFVAGQQPDVIALQDAIIPDIMIRDRPEFNGYPHMSHVGEYVLLSRYAVLSAEFLIQRLAMADGSTRGHWGGVRFVIDFNGQHVVIYGVHAPSPRYEFDQMFGLKKLSPAEPALGAIFWVQQRDACEQLIERIEAETLPTLVLGDWNMPPFGPVYRRITRRHLDAHAQAGRGYGFTCPGDLWTPVTLGSPWMRIDYVLSTRDWEVLECATVQASTAQHCAVGAVLRLR